MGAEMTIGGGTCAKQVLVKIMEIAEQHQSFDLKVFVKPEAVLGRL
jgi:hypothetical protein